MKNFLNTTKGKICAAVAAVILLAAAGFGGYEIWHYQQTKFHDLTIELGTDTVSISDFMTEYARPKKVGFVSDVSIIDLNKVGQTELTLSHGRQQETVTLTIQDTTAPTADFTTHVVIPCNQEPKAEDLVANVEDLSKTKVFFEQEPVMPEDYADVTASVVVEDAYGNRVAEECTITWQWIWDSYTLELGQELTKEMLLIDPEKDAELLDQAELDAINASDVGEYTLNSVTKARSVTCAITVQDTQGPVLELKEVQRYVGKSADVKAYVVSAEDASGEVELRLMTEVDFSVEGHYTIVIEAEDIHGNITTAETMLHVTTDGTPPEISGLTTLEVEKNGKPDYMSGVTSVDKVDGTCKVTYDNSGLDLTKAGTYYITYRSSDKSGNVATAKRKILVLPDEEDTKALVKSIADTLSNDPEAIRNYVRDRVKYNSDWGGSNPVWYGFTNKVGNCYVHAMCLKAIYDLKGIESQLIWCTDKTHYWLIVKIDGTWFHIDATPGVQHMKYSLMNDAMRYSTLSGRNWDRTQWPACG